LFFNETSQQSNCQLQKEQNTKNMQQRIGNKIDYLLTHSVEQCPSWEANRSTPNRENPSILWNLNVQYRMYKCPYPEPGQYSLGNRKQSKYKKTQKANRAIFD